MYYYISIKIENNILIKKEEERNHLKNHNYANYYIAVCT